MDPQYRNQSTISESIYNIGIDPQYRNQSTISESLYKYCLNYREREIPGLSAARGYGGEQGYRGRVPSDRPDQGPDRAPTEDQDRGGVYQLEDGREGQEKGLGRPQLQSRF